MRLSMMCIWCALLFATPYYMAHGSLGPALSSLYVWAAFGAILGLCVGSVYDFIEAFRSKIFLTVVAGVGLLASVIAVLPEFIGLPSYQEGNYEVAFLAELNLRDVWLPLQPWLFCGAFICVILLIQSAAAKTDTIREDGRDSILSPFGCAVASFLCGLAVRAVWLSLYPWSTLTFHPLFLQPDSWLINFVPLVMLCVILYMAVRIASLGDLRKTLEGFILGLALGVVVYSSLIRIFPLYLEDQTWIGFLAWGVLISVILGETALLANCREGVHVRKRNAESVSSTLQNLVDQGCSHKRPEECDLQDRFESYGLAKREEEITRLTLKGFSSKVVAEQLGLKPSSVRNTMSRVYTKIGISGKDELFELFGIKEQGEISLECDREAETVFHTEAHSKRNLMGLALLGMVLLFCFVEVPCFFQGKEWGAGRYYVYGCAIGMIIVGFSLYIESELSGSKRGIEKKPRTTKIVLWCIKALFLCLSSSCVLFAKYSDALLGAKGEGVAFLASMIFGICWSSISIGLVKDAFCRSSFCEKEEAMTKKDASCCFFEGGTQMRMNLILLSFVCLGLGFSWEEVWRGSVGESLVLLGVMYALVLIVIIIFVWKLSINKGYVVTLKGAIDKKEIELIGSFVLIAFGIGSLGADYSINKYYDLLYGNMQSIFAWGGLHSAVSAGAITVALFLFIALLCAAALCKQVYERIDCVAFSQDYHPITDARLFSYLEGRGLNKTQSSVLVGIARGLSSSEIAFAEHYSLGTVNSARHSGYRILGVHTKAQLLDLLRDHVRI